MTNPTQLTLPGETHRNHFLFSDYFLNHRLSEQPEWSIDVRPLLAQLTDLWRAFNPGAPNEAQTEADWIRPVLTALGHHFTVQVALQTPFGTRQPDYVLYPGEAERKAAPNRPLNAADLAGALAVADAKAWERDLDRGVGRAKVLSDNPSLQIYVYINYSGLDWGILTNGRQWRLVQRDTAEKLDVYYEVDLPALIEQQNADAFKYFALFFRREAFTAPPGREPFLNRVLAQSRAYSRGVSDTLKEQVYEALRYLAQGFLDLPANRLDPTPATLQAIFDNSLIVLYRLLFILYAESRGLLPVPANRLYTASYSLDALKRRIVRELTQGQPAAASMTTFWQQLRQLWQVIDQGNPDLAVPAYNGGLFKAKIGAFLAQYQVGDLHLRQAIDLLARAPDPQGQRAFVDYRDLEIRHLGSIYEGLLEYHLRVAAAPLAVRVEKGREVYEAVDASQTSKVLKTGEVSSEISADINPGEVYLITDKGERKATGSYYTPDYIVKYIVAQTVQPLLDDLRRQYSDDQGHISDPAGLEQAALRINVLDPSMGSGHFLVEATDVIARYLVQLELPTPPEAAFESDLAYWRRRVVQACIYGVDINPLAVELAKLSLWLTTVAQGKPLSFLDHHLRCGNSLIGTRVADLPLNVQSAGQKRQAKQRKKAEAEQRAAGQISMLDDSAFAGSMRTATNFMDQIEHLKGNTLAEIQEAEAVYRQVVDEVTAKARQLADVWTARQFGLTMDDRLWPPLVNFLTKGGLPLPAYDAI
ncbi:MAG: N-6 DNA methylase, partial [Anaerolineae bacterium]|nr:N-6 DNA methylase [Anaerolineae bacterium]